jgi:putative transposase
LERRAFMKKGRFTEEQIIGILREADLGKTIDEICRSHKISSVTFYKWRRKFKGMEVQDAKKMRAIEAENAKLKRLVAEQALDIVVLKDALGKK